MVVYVIATIISIIFAKIAEYYGTIETVERRMNDLSNKNERFIFRIHKYHLWGIVSGVPFIILSALRDDVGTDTKGTYWNIFQLVKVRADSGIRDKGYVLINRFALLFTDEYTGVLVVTSVIFGFFIFKAIYEQSISPIFSIFLYVITSVYFISMNMIRQGIATAIFLYSIKYIKRKDFIRYLFCILLASSVHLMAFIYLPIYFWDIAKLTKRKIIGIVFIGALVKTWLGDFIYSMIVKFDVLRQYFAHYYTSVYNSEDINIWSLLVEFVILILLLTIYNNAKEDKDYQFFLFLETISVFILCLSDVIPLAQRLSWMFSFSKILYLPKIVKMIPNKIVKGIVFIGVVIGFISYTYITAVIKGYNEVIPYQSIFSMGG